MTSAATTGGPEATLELADRLARFARAIFVVSVVMFGVSFVVGMTVSGTSLAYKFTDFGRLVHFAGTLLAFGVWVLGRRGATSRAVLEVVDALLTISLCTCWAMFGVTIPATEAIEFSIILAVTYTLMARSVILPSSFGRTLWISAVSSAPTVVVFARRGMKFAPSASEAQVQTFLVFMTLWCLVAVVTAGLNSRQLYGLRAQIREFGKLGQYTLESKLGEGGMGVVYRATHAMLRRPAAIKLLPADRTGEQDLARFEREVQLTSRLAHPNTVSIFDYGRTADGVFYYVMEYLEGVDLERLVGEYGPIAPPRAIHILAQVAGALAEAHAVGLVHRDIKPANIMLTSRVDAPDVVKVVDFGLAKTLVNEPGADALSMANAITGTPMYLAPETIASPDRIDGRADLYALGAVGYFLVTGEQVFVARMVLEVCSKHLTETPMPPSERLGAAVPGDLEALILGCLAKKPGDRPASAAELRRRLLECADAARYDVEAARAWWEREGPKLESPREKKSRSLGSAATMAIDLSGRQHAI